MLYRLNREFWEKNSAFYYGLILFLGALFSLQTPWALFPFVLILSRKRIFSAFLIFLLPCIFIYQKNTFPPLKSCANGYFHIQTCKESDRFGKGWIYQGKLEVKGKYLMCTCYSKTFYDPEMLYRVNAFLRSEQTKHYDIKILGPWESVKKRTTLVSLRKKAKSSVKNYILKHFPHEKSAFFITGMVTGELEQRVIKKEFSDLGLSHLMAISGLHFALIGLVFHLMLRHFLPAKIEALLLIALLTLYLLFIGETPSVLRAWITVLLFLSGQLLEREVMSLNSLGVALICILLWNPLFATHLSFQLSFLATAGILFFYRPCTQLLSLWLPQKTLSEACEKHWLWQHGYIILSFFREALALSLAVHIALAPLLFAKFHCFSLNSIIYNLFFPFLASIALTLFIAGIFLGHGCHLLNSWYCDTLLKITEAPPLFFEPFYIQNVPPSVLTVLLTSLLATALCLHRKKSTNSFLHI